MNFLGTLAQDLRYALRGFGRNPAFTLTAVLAMALGIGATTAVFSVVDRILFRSLPYPHEDQLVSLGMTAPIEPTEFVFGPDYLEWRRERDAFEGFASHSGSSDCDLSEQRPMRLTCVRVESTFLPLFGIQPVVGRNFTAEEDRPNAPRVALISHGLWRSRFGGDPGVSGRTISLDGLPTTIVGVLPADFEMPNLAQADVVQPQALNEAAQQRPQGAVLRVFARLKPGVTPAQAKAALEPLYERSVTFVPPRFQKMVGLRVRSVRDRQVQDARLASWILLGAVGAVLLIACANVANLLLARVAGRRRELAVRAALGAGRGRLIRQTLTESLVLALMGGIAGCVLAGLLLKLFVLIAPQGIPRLDRAALDLRVLLFTVGASLISGALFGMAPALENPFRYAGLAGSRALGPSRHLFRQFLMAGQFAVSVVLLAGAGLLLHSLWNMQRVPLGMEPETVLTADLALAVHSYPDPKRQAAFFEELEMRLARLPGVSAVALSDSVPPSGPMHVRPYVTLDVEGRPPMEPGIRDMVAWRMVSPGYFSALGIPILQGRLFQDQDRTSSENLVILSDSLARRLFPGENSLGKRIKLEPWFTVVGVARDVRNNGLSQADPEFYVVRKHSTDDPSWRSTSPRRATLLVRSSLSAQTVSEWIRSEAAQMDATLPVQIVPMTQRVERLSQRPRFNAVLLGLFAAMGVLLAAIGLYGVVSCLVIERTQEIGVRMALGATPARIAKMMLSHTARWTVAGAMAGLVGAWLATGWLTTLLFQVSARDPRILGAAVTLLLTVAMVAAWLPSRRAARVDPMSALRQE